MPFGSGSSAFPCSRGFQRHSLADRALEEWTHLRARTTMPAPTCAGRCRALTLSLRWLGSVGSRVETRRGKSSQIPGSGVVPRKARALIKIDDGFPTKPHIACKHPSRRPLPHSPRLLCWGNPGKSAAFNAAFIRCAHGVARSNPLTNISSDKPSSRYVNTATSLPTPIVAEPSEFSRTAR